MSEDRFDAIVVGAGPAGIASAYILAREGKNVLVIERGNSAGDKNVTGGRLYSYALDLVESGLWQEAALERKVVREKTMIMHGEQAITVDYLDPAVTSAGQRPQSYTILRAVFDEWFAAQAEEKGAIIACGVKVDELLQENGRVIGVKAGEDEMLADIVIAADGVNSFMAQQAGLIHDITAESVAVGVKEVIELPAKTIEERFHLAPEEGAAMMILGCTEGIHGGGFLYTNRDSISLGCVFMPEEAARHGRQVHDIMQDFKMHPAIYPMIADGQTIEYSAHLVSEAGYRGIPKKIYKDGFLMVGDAAGFVINTGYSIRGIDLAIVSGVAAARAILAEPDAGKVGLRYMQELKELKMLPTMQAVDGYFDLLEIQRIYKHYPAMANDLAAFMYKADGNVASSLKKAIRPIMKRNGITMWQLLKDGIRGYKSI
ncbi:MAG TPA: FAD-dependent oxidoreductase [Syntrophomonas sp.]|nr:FAD-dependent oxidoreductase [Syntrophomonas sp.]HRW12905.1 FAD-dependent oxidoreductase [Syntrophomonas sp.]